MKTTNEEIIIRLVNEDDLIESRKEFIKMLYENYHINFPYIDNLSVFANTNYDDMKKFCADGSALIIGAFIGVKVIGFLWAYKRVFLGEPRLHVSHIVVSSEFRGHGIGTKMMNHVEKIALQENAQIIELITTIENTNTIHFYEKHGFNVTRVQFEKNLGEKNDN